LNSALLKDTTWKLVLSKDAPPRKLASEKYASRKLAELQSASNRKLVPEKSTLPKNCEPLKYTDLIKFPLLLKSERLNPGR
jgi:hypothetical protein